MTYRWFVYFHGPKCWWSGKLHPDELIARGEAPFRWLARAQMMAALKPLDLERCAFLLERSDGELVMQYTPQPPEMKAVA